MKKKLLAKRVKTQNRKLRAILKQKKALVLIYKKNSNLSLKELQQKQLENEKMQLDEAEQAVEGKKQKRKRLQV